MISPERLGKLPYDWDLICACDTGTYMSAAFVAVPPDPLSLIVLEEFPNYRYVSNEIELIGMSTPEWARWVHSAYQRYKPGTTRIHLWADANSQFKSELAHYNLHLQSNFRGLELRVEILREYIHAGHSGEPHDPQRFFMAPWLRILPYELENAQWPDEVTTAGRFVRIKQNDHTLDCVEHIASRRPRAKIHKKKQGESFLERYLRENRKVDAQLTDPHLGSR